MYSVIHMAEDQINLHLAGLENKYSLFWAKVSANKGRRLDTVKDIIGTLEKAYNHWSAYVHHELIRVFLASLLSTYHYQIKLIFIMLYHEELHPHLTERNAHRPELLVFKQMQ